MGPIASSRGRWSDNRPGTASYAGTFFRFHRLLSRMTDVQSRVERWRGSVGTAYLLTGPFGCRCLTSRAIPRLHRPLIEPGVRIGRTRLSDQASCVRTRRTARSPLESKETQRLVQIPVVVA